MKSNDGRMQSLNDMISYGNDANPNQYAYTKTTTTRSNQPMNQSSQYSYTKTSQSYPSQSQNQTSTVTKTVIRNEEPVESSYTTKTVTTKKVITTTTRGGQNSSTQMNVSKYSNTGSSGGNRYQSTSTTSYNRSGQNTSDTNNNSQVYRGNQRNVIPPKRIGNTESYSANKYQPKNPGTSSYNNKSKSPEPGSLKRKTINRGDPIQNIQITHIIFTSRPTDFHITEDLDLENLKSQPIKISKADRARLQKSGKVTTTCSCDGVEIAQPKKLNLKGSTKIYQHAQGIGMTNDKSRDINPMFYSSEIKVLKPINRGKEKEKLENIETFRSSGKNYYTEPSTSKYNAKSSTYNRGKMNNTSSQKKSYVSGTSNNTYNRGGMGSSVKTTSTVYRGSNMGGQDGEIIKETNTKVQMGSRSQYNQSKPTTYTTSERKVYNQKNFFNK